MSKDFTKEDVISNKKAAIKALNNLLEHYINDPSGNHLKKANFILVERLCAIYKL